MSQIEQYNPELHDLLDEIGELREERQWRCQLEALTQAMHRSLNPAEVAYTIANDGRLVLDCDRLSVVLRRRGRYRLEAISGQETINHRANTVRLLQHLCKAVLATGEGLQYPSPSWQSAPQITVSLDAYLDQSHAKSLMLVPLRAPDKEVHPDEPLRGSKPLLGAIVIEEFSGAEIDLTQRQRAEAVTHHAASALNNSLEHQRIFLLPLWSALGKLSKVSTDRSISRCVLLAIFLVLLAGLLYVVPADFTLTATGTLQPEQRRNVFARMDGVVSELFVREGTAVTEGQALAKLRNTELDLKMEEVVGQLQTTSSKLAGINASRLANMSRPDRDPTRDNELAGEVEELRQWLASLRQQQELLLQQKTDLELSSPIRGEVITWSVQETLAARPVRRGQLLLTVADLDGPWVLELLLPDRRVGHLLSARRDLGPDLDVSFILATDPNQEVRGRIKQVANSTQVDQQQGQTVLVTVSFDKQDVALLRPGAGVTGKIHCGRRALGYVWLHDLFEFVQSKILFRI